MGREAEMPRPTYAEVRPKREIKAQTGRRLQCQNWDAEAALRMLRNNLDPRVVIANSNIVPKWATQENFDRYDEMGLTMYGQMTAGSWIYIGTQGILQGTYETLAALARKEFGKDSLAGKFILTAGMGGMSGAQPMAATMNGAVILDVEVRPERIERKVKEGFWERMRANIKDALGCER